MKTVAKYNICKGVSTLLTMGTPIVTLACCGSFFRERSSTAISAAGLMVILISLLFAKDKIAENFKAPSAFAIAGIVLVLPPQHQFSSCRSFISPNLSVFANIKPKCLYAVALLGNDNS